jgi:hypothetical protein
MSIKTCLPGLVESGKIDAETAERAARLFDELEPVYRRQFGSQTAAAMASEEALARMEKETFQRRRRALLQAAAQKDAEKWLRGGGENWGGGGRRPTGAVPGAGEPGPINPHAARTLIARMDARRKAIEARAFSMMEGILARHRRNLFGVVRHRAELDEIGRAAYGEAVDSPAAKELADGWLGAAEMLRQRANAAGANIGRLERWGLPQSHDSRAVAEAGFAAWRDFTLPLIDAGRMMDPMTGAPVTPAGLELGLRAMFDTVASDGMNKVEAGAIRPSRMAAGSLDEHRFLIFRDYDSWAAYQARFGVGTAFDAMMNHVHGMARVVAAMEELGPHPEATVRWVQDRIKGDEALRLPGKLRARDTAATQAKGVERLWDEYTGALREPYRRSTALVAGSYRSVATAAYLGGAPLSAVSDIGFGVATRKFNGLPAARILADYLKQLNPASQADRRLAARMGFAADTWTGGVAAHARLLGEELTGEVSRRIADGVIRGSGLAALTDAGRGANGLAFVGHVTDMSVNRWDQLDAPFQAVLERYGIGPDGWEALRRTPLEVDRGAPWLKPQNVENRELGDRYLMMAINEGEFAVPVADLETRAYMNANFARGTIFGEVVRSGPLMFKSFGISVLIRQAGRMMDQPGWSGKAGYLIALMVPVTIMGALSLHMKEIAKGRDPRPMDPREEEGRALWAHALVQGGGFGIAGDLMRVSAESRVGSWARWFAGPLGDDGEQLASGVSGMVRDQFHQAGALEEGDPRAYWRTARVLRENTPGNNLWYARLAIDRLLADRIQQAIDPDYADGFERVRGYAEEAGTDYWWEPGAAEPGRAPDLGNALPPDVQAALDGLPR